MKASTSLRTKKRGNVPPKLDTLILVSEQLLKWARKNLRSQESHVGASNNRVCDSSMECRNSNEHDRVSEG